MNSILTRITDPKAKKLGVLFTPVLLFFLLKSIVSQTAGFWILAACAVCAAIYLYQITRIGLREKCYGVTAIIWGGTIALFVALFYYQWYLGG